jgi:uncharacterized protein with GYD domain
MSTSVSKLDKVFSVRGIIAANQKEDLVATYISLIQFTQQGLAAIKESPKRLDAARKAFEQVGAKIKDFYLVMGKYDIVIIAEAPNDEAITKTSLILGSKGNVRTRTSRAFTEAEYRKMIDSLP